MECDEKANIMINAAHLLLAIKHSIQINILTGCCANKAACILLILANCFGFLASAQKAASSTTFSRHLQY